MFRRWPIFQRMLSWTKPYSAHERGSAAYERFDWNSLLGEDERTRAIMPRVMDGTSYFPSRPEMEKGLAAFAERARIKVRYGCSWESTQLENGEFVLTTSDGEYRAQVAVFAVGVAEPWRPPVLNVEGVQQYGDLLPVDTYADRRVFIVGKKNSGFEIAKGLLPWARQIVLASQPDPALGRDPFPWGPGAYVQPYEDWALAGGVVILDASIESVKREGNHYRVHTKAPGEGRALDFEVDDVIAATGFTCPLRDLPQLGVATFGQATCRLRLLLGQCHSARDLFRRDDHAGGAGPSQARHPEQLGACRATPTLAFSRATLRSLGSERAPSAERAGGRRRAAAAREASRGPELWHRVPTSRVFTADAAVAWTMRG
jgi:hypothetical protein